MSKHKILISSMFLLVKHKKWHKEVHVQVKRFLLLNDFFDELFTWKYLEKTKRYFENTLYFQNTACQISEESLPNKLWMQNKPNEFL